MVARRIVDDFFMVYGLSELLAEEAGGVRSFVE